MTRRLGTALGRQTGMDRQRFRGVFGYSHRRDAKLIEYSLDHLHTAQRFYLRVGPFAQRDTQSVLASKGVVPVQNTPRRFPREFWVCQGVG